MEINKNITYFGETDFRSKRTPFGIKTLDRARHMYIIGKTGMGKSTLLETLAIQDIQNGNGMTFIDPHGGSAEKLLDYVPKERIKDVIYFAPHDIDYPISFNVMEDVGKDQRHLVANGLMASFKKIWPDVWSARMEYISMNIILALLEYPGSTLLGINRMLSDKNYRKKVVDNITDPSVKSFWVNEFAKYSDKIMVEAGASIQNKFGQFSSNPLIRNIIGQPKSSFNLRDVMDTKKIFIANLSKGRMGEINTQLIGGMLITKIYLAAMSRAGATDAELKKLPHFYTYVDEFQSFVNDSFADILSEARKYKLNLIIAHQYIEQMPETVRNAVFGNVGTTIAFRVGPFDAEVLEKIFAPKFTAEDIVNLGFAQIYLTLMIDGVGSQPFSAKTVPPIPPPADKFTPEIITSSRAAYAKPRAAVEDEIKKWHEEADGEGEMKPFDKTAVKKELEGIKKEYGVGDFPPKRTFGDKPFSGKTYSSRPAYSSSSSNFDGRQSGSAPVVSASSEAGRASQPRYAGAGGNAYGGEQKKTYVPSVKKPYVPPATVQAVTKEPASVPAPAPVPQKVSLSSLSKERPADVKSTGKNADALKNILAKAMGGADKKFVLGKTGAKVDTGLAEEKEKIIEEGKPVVLPDKEERRESPSAPVSKPIAGTETKEKEAIKTKEVPEDVLRKVISGESK